jgi:hypothetical protein
LALSSPARELLLPAGVKSGSNPLLGDALLTHLETGAEVMGFPAATDSLFNGGVRIQKAKIFIVQVTLSPARIKEEFKTK